MKAGRGEGRARREAIHRKMITADLENKVDIVRN
jgi:hypothetical protein